MALFVIFSLHFPIEHFYFDDENFVLPERLWFTSSWDWLTHVLFFNQTRYTWAGDFILVRPGLFAWMWLQDLFRSDRLFIQGMVAGVHVFVWTASFLFLRRSTGAILAAVFALYAVVCVIGRQLFTWPHINGYAASIGFYVLAIHLYLAERPTLGKRIAAALSFFLACVFYELTALTVPFLLITEHFFARKKKKKEALARLFTLLAPLGAFALVVLFAQFVLRPQGMSPIQELAPTEFSTGRFLLVWFHFIRNLAFVSLPFPTESETLAYAKTLFFISGFSYLIWKGWRERTSEDRRTFIVAFVPLLALVLGVGLGRVGPRAVIKEHYYPLFHFFTWLSLAALLGRSLLKSRILYGGMLVLLLGSVLWTSHWIDVIKAVPAEEAQAQINTVNEIQKIVHEKGGCFGGWADYVARESQNGLVNSALLQESCARKEGTPVFVQSFDKMSVHAVDLSDSAGLPEEKSLIASLAAPVSSDFLQAYLAARPPNLAQMRAGRIDGTLQIRQTNESLQSRVLKAHWKSKDEGPSLWNVGLTFESGSIHSIVLLRDNLLEVFSARDGKPMNTVSSPLFSVQSPLELKIVKVQGPYCRFYVNSLLLFQFWNCPVELTNVGVVSFDNGTPPEELQSIISQ